MRFAGAIHTGAGGPKTLTPSYANPTTRESLMKSSLFLALLLVAGAVGLGVTGLMVSQGDSHVASILPAAVFYTGACIAFVGALASLIAAVCGRA